ncbi:MAG: LCP family protein [Solirubrobacterales bacterium]
MSNLRKKPKGRFRFLLVISVLLVLVFCVGGYAYSYLLNLSSNSDSGDTEPVKTAEVKEDGIVNILITGVDIGDTKVNIADDKRRTDTIILLNYNPKTEEINVVSIPRDTLIKIKGQNQKINSANVLGGKNYIVTAVENLLNLDINYTARVDYEGFRKIIDAIGGVDMYISQNMFYDDASQNLHIYFKKGQTVHLDGKKAEEFFRWRKNNDGTGLAEGDLGRINNQHLFIEKVIEKFKSPDIVTKIPSIMGIIPKYVTTNMQPNDMLKYAYKFINIDKSKVTMSTLKGTTPTIEGISYFVYDEKENSQLLSVLRGETTSTKVEQAELKLDKSNIKIQVLNGTNKSGLAAAYAENLKKAGFKNVTTGNGPKAQTSKATLYGIDASLISTVKSEFKIENIETNKQKSGNFDIIILLGENYKLGN